MCDSKQNPYLTIVIPAYNEEMRLPPTLARVADFLRRQSYTAEILVVENGSTDQTSKVVEQFCEQSVQSDDPFLVRLLHSEKGKGKAVRHGILNGAGEYLLVSDTDLAVPIEEVERFLPALQEQKGRGIAIASREVPGSIRHGEPIYRHIMGRVFNYLVRKLAVPGIHDTQCGFKCFSREAAWIVFPLQRIDGWGFDVELLYIAQRHGLPIVEIPVNWYYGNDSRVRPLHDTITMVTDLLAIRRNRRAGLYDAVSSSPMTDKLPAV